MSKTIEISRELLENLARRAEVFGVAEELRAILAAPVVERQEPVAWMDKESGALATVSLKPLLEGFDTPLYTSPPAPVAVVLPERKTVDVMDGALDNARKRGYNACLDKVKELNQ